MSDIAARCPVVHAYKNCVACDALAAAIFAEVAQLMAQHGLSRAAATENVAVTRGLPMAETHARLVEGEVEVAHKRVEEQGPRWKPAPSPIRLHHLPVFGAMWAADGADIER